MSVPSTPMSTGNSPTSTPSVTNVKLKYPKVLRAQASYYMHGKEINNPYEYLEDGNREETKAFVESQNQLFSAFASYAKGRDQVREKLMDTWTSFPQLGVPMRKGNKSFFWENSGKENHSVLHMKEDGKNETLRVLDPNRWDRAGRAAITSYSIRNDGKYVAYGVSRNGSDWATIKIRDTDCGHDLEDSLYHVKLTNLTWTNDGKGFFYKRYPELDEEEMKLHSVGSQGAMLFYHVIGTGQDEDVLVVEFPDNPTWSMYSEISDDGAYLFVHASDVIGEKYLFYTALSEGVKERMPLSRIFPAPGNHWYLANDGDKVYFMSTVGAPNYHQVVRVDLSTAGQEENEATGTVLVSDQGHKVHSAFVVNQDRLVICNVRDILCRIEIRDLKTGAIIEQLPLEPGTVTATYGKRTDNEFYFRLESYTNPGIVYKVTFPEAGGKVLVQKHKAVETLSYKMDDFVFNVFSYCSNDGTNIPLILIHKKDLVRDSDRPCILTAYGGYGISKLPSFQPAYLFFAQHFNGIVAVANIRGGGEFGRAWWDEGRLLNKKNCFEDFIAAARFLLNNSYTKPKKLAITGASNGGLLIGACMNKRPDLFGAAIPQVGIMDMLRYHKFTVGHLWVGEFGSPEDETYFHYLREYSPLHNIVAPEDGQYPAVLVTTDEGDDRVVPSHSYKYAAQLQYMSYINPRQKNPVLLKTYKRGGHVAGKPRQREIEEWTDIFSFLELTLDFTFQP